jgi:hypothetical protein
MVIACFCATLLEITSEVSVSAICTFAPSLQPLLLHPVLGQVDGIAAPALLDELAFHDCHEKGALV